MELSSVRMLSESILVMSAWCVLVVVAALVL